MALCFHLCVQASSSCVFITKVIKIVFQLCVYGKSSVLRVSCGIMLKPVSLNHASLIWFGNLSLDWWTARVKSLLLHSNLSFALCCNFKTNEATGQLATDHYFSAKANFYPHLALGRCFFWTSRKGSECMCACVSVHTRERGGSLSQSHPHHWASPPLFCSSCKHLHLNQY